MEIELRPDQLEFPFNGGRLCLDFVGTVGQRSSAAEYERLRQPGDLARWVVAAGLADRVPRIDEAALGRAREVREAIYRSVATVRAARRPETDDVRLINGVAAWPARVPQLDLERLEVFWTARRPLQAALSTVARDAVELLGGGLMQRVRECAAEDCSLLFLDLSRGARRRWCSMERCGNRAKTATYRHKRAGAGHGSGSAAEV